MPDYTAKRIDDMYATYRGAFKHARAELGVTSFGFQVIDLPPNSDAYPEHDHTHDDQEEVYIALSGSADMDIEGEHVRLGPDTMVRVGVGTKRKLTTSDEPLRVLIIGGVPGKAYEPQPNTAVGAPDPIAQH
jgi:mannose-6-phosphate isomerase-like protein (cupin superfamily)